MTNDSPNRIFRVHRCSTCLSDLQQPINRRLPRVSGIAATVCSPEVCICRPIGTWRLLTWACAEPVRLGDDQHVPSRRTAGAARGVQSHDDINQETLPRRAVGFVYVPRDAAGQGVIRCWAAQMSSPSWLPDHLSYARSSIREVSPTLDTARRYHKFSNYALLTPSFCHPNA